MVNFSAFENGFEVEAGVFFCDGVLQNPDPFCVVGFGAVEDCSAASDGTHPVFPGDGGTIDLSDCLEEDAVRGSDAEVHGSVEFLGEGLVAKEHPTVPGDMAILNMCVVGGTFAFSSGFEVVDRLSGFQNVFDHHQAKEAPLPVLFPAFKDVLRSLLEPPKEAPK